MYDIAMFDAYFDWTKINTKGPNEIKKILTGTNSFQSDQLSDTLLNMLINLNLGKALDYGAGLGRNVGFIKGFSKEVDYIDLIQYKDVLIHIVNKELYDKFYFIEDPKKGLVLEEEYDIVYASVIFQHIVDENVLKNIFNELYSHTKYLLTIQNHLVTPLDGYLDGYFDIVYQEINACGFSVPHVVQLWVNCRYNKEFRNLYNYDVSEPSTKSE